MRETSSVVRKTSKYEAANLIGLQVVSLSIWNLSRQVKSKISRGMRAKKEDSNELERVKSAKSRGKYAEKRGKVIN